MVGFGSANELMRVGRVDRFVDFRKRGIEEMGFAERKRSKDIPSFLDKRIKHLFKLVMMDRSIYLRMELKGVLSSGERLTRKLLE